MHTHNCLRAIVSLPKTFDEILSLPEVSDIFNVQSAYDIPDRGVFVQQSLVNSGLFTPDLLI